MEGQYPRNYHRIAEAIAYIQENFKSQPSLEEVAEKMNLSAFHFQRMFTEWAGISPKKFLQFTSIAYARRLLKAEQATLFEATSQTGLSGTSRLHDLFVTIEGMSPAEYKHGGKDLHISYSLESSPFGDLMVASTSKGVCSIAFTDDEQQGLEDLINRFPNASFTKKSDDFQKAAIGIFQSDWSQLDGIKLHLKGTPFQLKVWETLLTIPMGELSTYSRIANMVDSPKASRAVGTAIGSNPIAFLIPCHRVIQTTGALGGYMWGLPRKSAIIGWEAAQRESILASSPQEQGRK